jgi:SAM-dependent methyltransferase
MMDRATRVEMWDRAGRADTYAQAIHPSGVAGTGGPAWHQSGLEHAQQWTAGFRRHADYEPATILDFGCGAGRVTFPLAALWPRSDIEAVDASGAMLGRLLDDARVGPGGSGTVVPSLSDGFDGKLPAVEAVHSMITLLHYSWADGAELLRRLLLALPAGGLAGVNLPLYDNATQSADWTGVTTWSPGQLLEVTEDLAVVLEARVSPGTFQLGAVGPHHGAYHWLRRL